MILRSPKKRMFVHTFSLLKTETYKKNSTHEFSLNLTQIQKTRS